MNFKKIFKDEEFKIYSFLLGDEALVISVVGRSRLGAEAVLDYVLQVVVDGPGGGGLEILKNADHFWLRLF